MAHGTVHQIFQMNVDGVAQAYTEEWAWYLAIECPVIVGCSICELTFDLYSFEVDAHLLRFTISNWGRDLGGITNDIRAGRWRIFHDNRPAGDSIVTHGHSCRSRTIGCAACDLKFSFHAGFAMPRNDAV